MGGKENNLFDSTVNAVLYTLSDLLIRSERMAAERVIVRQRLEDILVHENQYSGLKTYTEII